MHSLKEGWISARVVKSEEDTGDGVVSKIGKTFQDLDVLKASLTFASINSSIISNFSLLVQDPGSLCLES